MPSAAPLADAANARSGCGCPCNVTTVPPTESPDVSVGTIAERVEEGFRSGSSVATTVTDKMTTSGNQRVFLEGRYLHSTSAANSVHYAAK